MKEENIENEISELKEFKTTHLNLAKDMFEAYNGAMYPVDLLAGATLHRSLNLLFGFCDLIHNRNVISSTPLVRLQIDNCIRFYATFIVSKPHEFAMDIFKGKPINKIKDENNHLMTDSYLVNKISKYEPWIVKVYKETSGWVHLSEKHFSNIITPNKDQDLKLFIGLDDKFVPDSLYFEEIRAFSALTKLLFKWIEGWIYTKRNPELVQKQKEEYKEKFGYLPKY